MKTTFFTPQVMGFIEKSFGWSVEHIKNYYVKNPAELNNPAG